MKLTDSQRKALEVIEAAQYGTEPQGIRPTVPTCDNWVNRGGGYSYVDGGYLRTLRATTADKLIDAGLIRADYAQGDEGHRFLKLMITEEGRAALAGQPTASGTACDRCQGEGDGKNAQTAAFYVERFAHVYRLGADGEMAGEAIESWELEGDAGFTQEYVCKHHALELGMLDDAQIARALINQ